ncbi:MAG: CHAT domain-containing tetratricopeptide repeat protein [Bacteroidia bacterium]|nr:CHAT domain-containing tetratricopeptide repeat protein [Bacteroidia bacterium]
MKFIFYSVSICFGVFSFAQTWQSAYDSCLRYQKKQQYKKAIEWGDKALELYERQVAFKDTNYSNILLTQAENCYHGGDYRRGEEYAKKDSIWTLKENMLAKYSDACNILAALYHAGAKYKQAEEIFRKLQKLNIHLFGKEHENYISACNNLAILYQTMGKYSEAEILLKEVMQIDKKKLGEDHLEYATTCNNLALVYRYQGRYEEAEALYKKALTIRERKLGMYHNLFVNTCFNLAGLYVELNKYNSAESLFKICVAVYEKVLGAKHPRYANVLGRLGDLYYKKGNYVDAIASYEKAMKIIIENMGANHKSFGIQCNALATVYVEQKKYSVAESLYKKGLDITRLSFEETHPEYSRQLAKLAHLYQIMKRYEEAEKLYTKVLANKMLEVQFNFINLSENEKEKYVDANVNSYFNDFQSFVIKRYLENPRITEYAYDLVLVSKGLIFQNIEKIKNRILNSRDKDLVITYTEWKNSKDEYAKIQSLSLEQRRQKKIDLDSIARKINEYEKQLALKSEDFAHTFSTKPITWKDIQHALKKNEAAIEIVRIAITKDKFRKEDSILYAALIVKKDIPYPDIAVLPLGGIIETKYFTYYRRSIKTKVDDKESYNVFWKPIADRLKGIKTVYFSPDGIYHQVNVSTLYNTETKKYVFDEIQVINVTNTRDILEQHKQYSNKSFLIGNPMFNLGIDTKDNEKSIEQWSIENLSQLEGAEREVKQICMFLPNAVTVTGVAATEEFVKSLRNPRVLHIATHGYFKKGQYQTSTQAMLNAGLLLAGVIDYDRMEIRPLDKEDGKLTAFEVMNMELDSTELVVLSACETGLGQTSKEGVYGLQRAFKVAGAQSIIMSLWKVNDEATQLLMTKFYENWQKRGIDKRKAFEAAQKEVRKRYKEPYYWGAFVMIE